MVGTRVVCLGVVLMTSRLVTCLAAPATQLSLTQTLQLLDNIQRERDLEEEVRSNLATYDEDEEVERRQDEQEDDDRDREGELHPHPGKHHLLDKKANYMSLCHFKLCNMGKRNSWRNRAAKPGPRHHH